MRWLHRFLHDLQQLLMQLIEVYLLAQQGTEGRNDPGCIILAAIEAAVNEGLEVVSQRLEKGHNHLFSM
jgi:hypothetical protein